MKLFMECEVCSGSGFSGLGTMYGDVCSECGGLKFLPVDDPAPVKRMSTKELVDVLENWCFAVGGPWNSHDRAERVMKRSAAVITTLRRSVEDLMGLLTGDIAGREQIVRIAQEAQEILDQ